MSLVYYLSFQKAIATLMSNDCSSDIVEIENCGPTTWQHLRCMVEGLGIADSQRKEGLGMEERLEDSTRLVGPVAIISGARSLASKQMLYK